MTRTNPPLRPALAFVAISSVLLAAPLRGTAQNPAIAGGTSNVPIGSRALLVAPLGDTAAVLFSAGSATVVEFSENWVKVRVEGWIPRAQAGSLTPAAGATSPTLAAIRSDPEQYQGALVRWSVQYLGLQRADPLRSDLEVGEAYLLVRDPGGEAGFVYVVVPPELLTAASSLTALQRFEVVGRVRAGRSALTGHPILELIELRP